MGFPKISHIFPWFSQGFPNISHGFPKISHIFPGFLPHWKNLPTAPSPGGSMQLEVAFIRLQEAIKPCHDLGWFIPSGYD